MPFLTKAKKETRATKDAELCRLNDGLRSARMKTTVNPDGFMTTLSHVVTALRFHQGKRCLLGF